MHSLPARRAAAALSRAFDSFHRRLERLAHWQLLTIAVGGVLIVGWIDYLTGYEVSLSLFYLAPVSLAAAYSGRRAGIALAVLCCLAGYVVSQLDGNFSHPAVPVWNGIIRFGVFLSLTLLLTALRQSLRVQRDMAGTDALTDLFGRRGFDDRLAHDLAVARRHGGSLSLAYVDLDNFKQVNDGAGHAAGDEVLRTVGRVMKSAVRESDTAARIGGDEFALVLPDTDEAGARQLVAKIGARLDAALAAGGWGVTCSIGVVIIHDFTLTPAAAVHAADRLMYEVKRSGKGRAAYQVLVGGRPATA